jgi:hypothetical protein
VAEYLRDELERVRKNIKLLLMGSDWAKRSYGITLETLEGQLEALAYFLDATPYKEVAERYEKLLWWGFRSPMPWYWYIIKFFNRDMFVRSKLEKRIIGPANALISLAEQYAATLPKVSSVKEVEEIPQMGIDIETFERIHNSIPQVFFLQRQIVELNNLKIYANTIGQLPFSPDVQRLAQSLSTVLEDVPDDLTPESGEYKLVEKLVRKLYAAVKEEFEVLKDRLKV